ncbi:ESX-1 secretion system protein EccCa1 [Arthrobacter sp. SO5]|uniref:FtsK/SpoIIIE domain-containing protein n=1 Tax=Arthrobacter sp. SO5 TaxID=1897055 RepID=UPI001E53CAF9|nr:FtsK/SpoIIIE domain-containing protein [Arthrobacter sp. SO5]MCB5273847.1 ESX-1 secretion system protein EccCa1 [Arthrobacter sp. SO5]
MMLHCTLVAAPGSSLATGPLELAVQLPASCPGLALETAVALRYGTGTLTVDGAPLVTLTAGEPPLVSGVVLVDGFGPESGTALGEPASGPSPLLLTVGSGPGAGMVIPLRRGRYRIGRSGTEIVIPDAELSREHARLDVSNSAVTIVDLNSANGTTVDGRRVHTMSVTTASSVRCGNSSISLIFTGSADTGVPATAGCSVADPITVATTSATAHRGVLVATAVLPLAIGIGLAVITGMWMFLAFTAVSAVSVLVPVVSGRRQRRELRSAVGAAVREDRERRRRSAPSAAQLLVRGAPGPFPVSPAGPGRVWLRLGLAEQTANIRLEPPDSAFRRPPLGLMPVTLDPAPAATTVRGPQSAVAGLVRSFLLQLAVYPVARRTRVLIHGPLGSLPLNARFLAAATLSCDEAATLAALEAGPGHGYDRGLLMILAGAGSSLLCAAAARNGWQVIDCSATEPASHAGPSTGQSVVLGERTGRLSSDHASLEFIPDLVPDPVFDRFCRGSGSADVPEEAAPPAAIPDACSLSDVLTLSATAIARRWSESALHPGLPAVVGISGSGPVRLDLQSDGPHFLVAGTTGSGKSEFLRTLVASLAGSHPPGRLNLLFIDFKGGSGLGPLTGLPHCVGLLTDLGTKDIGRTLVSLRAEVRRREELLGACRAPDLRAYESLDGAQLQLPHLVLVIDEFRMLVEEAPEALAELMRIAAMGRSLGIHLVMATQRPQGSITADIRANVTSSIALRVQSEMESLDIINSKLAAAIPITVPGRAYVVRGNEAPEEFQTATVLPSAAREEPVIVAVMTAAEFLCRTPASVSVDPEPTAGSSSSRALAPLIEATTALWESLGGSPPRRPVADPLPARLAFPLDALPADVGHEMVRLGRLDLPEEQRTTELRWSPSRHGHLGLVGGGPGGTDAALALAVDQLLSGQQETHLYLLDAAGSFGGGPLSARVGAAVGPHELRRAARVLERLAEEMTLRLSAGDAGDSPNLVLILNGWGSWASAFRAGPLAGAEDLVHDLVCDGAKAGITVLATGQRELVTARFFAAIPNRAFFPAGSTEEGRLAWPRLPSTEALPGRLAAFGPYVEGSSTAGHAGQLFDRPTPAVQNPLCRNPERRPFRIEQLPPLVTVAEVLGRGVHPPFSGQGRLCLGVGGDELLPTNVVLPRAGVLAVLGARGSGKSSLLCALPALNPSVPWLRPPAGADPGEYWSRIQAEALAGSLDRAAILLADDLDLQSADTNGRLLALNSLGWRVVLTAGFSQVLLQRVPLAVHARSHGQGVLIAPRSLLDGDVFGVRFDVDPSPPPGRAVVISDGRATTVQLAIDPSTGTMRPP